MRNTGLIQVILAVIWTVLSFLLDRALAMNWDIDTGYVFKRDIYSENLSDLISEDVKKPEKVDAAFDKKFSVFSVVRNPTHIAKTFRDCTAITNTIISTERSVFTKFCSDTDINSQRYISFVVQKNGVFQNNFYIDVSLAFNQEFCHDTFYQPYGENKDSILMICSKKQTSRVHNSDGLKKYESYANQNEEEYLVDLYNAMAEPETNSFTVYRYLTDSSTVQFGFIDIPSSEFKFENEISARFFTFITEGSDSELYVVFASVQSSTPSNIPRAENHKIYLCRINSDLSDNVCQMIDLGKKKVANSFITEITMHSKELSFYYTEIVNPNSAQAEVSTRLIFQKLDKFPIEAELPDPVVILEVKPSRGASISRDANFAVFANTAYVESNPENPGGLKFVWLADTVPKEFDTVPYFYESYLEKIQAIPGNQVSSSNPYTMGAIVNFDPIRGYNMLAIWTNDQDAPDQGYFKYTWVQRDTQVPAVDGSGCFFLYEVYYLKAMCDFTPYLEFDSTFINRSDESVQLFSMFAVVYDKGSIIKTNEILIDGFKNTNFWQIVMDVVSLDVDAFVGGYSQLSIDRMGYTSNQLMIDPQSGVKVIDLNLDGIPGDEIMSQDEYIKNSIIWVGFIQRHQTIALNQTHILFYRYKKISQIFEVPEMYPVIRGINFYTTPNSIYVAYLSDNLNTILVEAFLSSSEPVIKAFELPGIATHIEYAEIFIMRTMRVLISFSPESKSNDETLMMFVKNYSVPAESTWEKISLDGLHQNYVMPQNYLSKNPKSNAFNCKSLYMKTDPLTNISKVSILSSNSYYNLNIKFSIEQSSNGEHKLMEPEQSKNSISGGYVNVITSWMAQNTNIDGCVFESSAIILNTAEHLIKIIDLINPNKVREISLYDFKFDKIGPFSCSNEHQIMVLVCSYAPTEEGSVNSTVIGINGNLQKMDNNIPGNLGGPTIDFTKRLVFVKTGLVFQFGVSSILCQSGRHDIYILVVRKLIGTDNQLEKNLQTELNSPHTPLYQKFAYLKKFQQKRGVEDSENSLEDDPLDILRFFKVKVDRSNLFFNIQSQDREIEKQYVAFASYNTTVPSYNFALKVFSRVDTTKFSLTSPPDNKLPIYQQKTTPVSDFIFHTGSYVSVVSSDDNFPIMPRYYVRSSFMMSSYTAPYKYQKFIGVTTPYTSDKNYTFMAMQDEENLHINFFDQEEQIKSYLISDNFNGGIRYRITENCTSIVGILSTNVSPVIFQFDTTTDQFISSALNIPYIFESYGFSIYQQKISMFSGLQKNDQLKVYNVQSLSKIQTIDTLNNVDHFDMIEFMGDKVILIYSLINEKFKAHSLIYSNIFSPESLEIQTNSLDFEILKSTEVRSIESEVTGSDTVSVYVLSDCYIEQLFVFKNETLGQYDYDSYSYTIYPGLVPISLSLTNKTIIVSAFEPEQKRGWFIFYEKTEDIKSLRNSLPRTAFPFVVADIDEVKRSAISGYPLTESTNPNSFYFISGSNPTIQIITLQDQEMRPKIAQPKKNDVKDVQITFSFPNPKLSESFSLEKFFDFGFTRPKYFYEQWWFWTLILILTIIILSYGYFYYKYNVPKKPMKRYTQKTESTSFALRESHIDHDDSRVSEALIRT